MLQSPIETGGGGGMTIPPVPDAPVAGGGAASPAAPVVGMIVVSPAAPVVAGGMVVELVPALPDWAGVGLPMVPGIAGPRTVPSEHPMNAPMVNTPAAAASERT